MDSLITTRMIRSHSGNFTTSRTMGQVAITAKRKQVHTCSGASLVAQWVKNLPVIQEVLVQFLGWEDPLEKG